MDTGQCHKIFTKDVKDEFQDTYNGKCLGKLIWVVEIELIVERGWEQASMGLVLPVASTGLIISWLISKVIPAVQASVPLSVIQSTPRGVLRTNNFGPKHLCMAYKDKKELPWGGDQMWDVTDASAHSLQATWATIFRYSYKLLKNLLYQLQLFDSGAQQITQASFSHAGNRVPHCKRFPIRDVVTVSQSRFVLMSRMMRKILNQLMYLNKIINPPGSETTKW